jgi:hypothetical protein
MRDEGLLCKIDNEISEKNNVPLIPHTPLNQIVAPTSNAASSSVVASSLLGQQMNQTPSITIMSTSCQNITNLQQHTANICANKMMLKCGDEMNGSADYEGKFLTRNFLLK